jgi:hypothetical protein
VSGKKLSAGMRFTRLKNSSSELARHKKDGAFATGSCERCDIFAELLGFTQATIATAKIPTNRSPEHQSFMHHHLFSKTFSLKNITVKDNLPQAQGLNPF